MGEALLSASHPLLLPRHYTFINTTRPLQMFRVWPSVWRARVTVYSRHII